jgi:hypothetical protein
MAELKPAFEKREREDQFWSRNYERLLAEYPERFVAALDGKVIAASRTLTELDTTLRQRGLSPRDVAIQWISQSHACLVL